MFKYWKLNTSEMSYYSNLSTDSIPFPSKSQWNFLHIHKNVLHPDPCGSAGWSIVLYNKKSWFHLISWSECIPRLWIQSIIRVSIEGQLISFFHLSLFSLPSPFSKNQWICPWVGNKKQNKHTNKKFHKNQNKAKTIVLQFIWNYKSPK